MNDSRNLFVEKQKDFLNFLKTRFNIFHESNVFFRDLHYGVMSFLQIQGKSHQYSSTEDLTKQIIEEYEGMKVLVRIDDRTWMLNYPPFKKPIVKAAVEAKPSATLVKPAASIANAATNVLQQKTAVAPLAVQGEVAG
jgi:hypothetical protein